MAVRPPDLVYAVDDVPPPQRLVGLGLQYAILIAVYLITLVLVAREAKASDAVAQDIISLGLIACAAGVALQAWRGRLFGSGFLAPPVFSVIYIGPSLIAARHGGLPAVAGMTVFAGLVEIALAMILPRLRVIFQPSITGFIIFIIGIQLGILALTEVLDVPEAADPGFGWHVAVGVLTLAVATGLSIWGPGALRLMCSLIGLVAGVAAGVAAGMIGETEWTHLASVGWVGIPDPRIVSWGFDPALVPAFIAAALAATIRTVGVVTTAERMNDAAWRRPDPDNLRRGVVADGLGSVVGGLLGGIGMCAAASLVAMSGATGATSRAIAWAAAGFLLVFAFVPKISAFIITLPIEIVGALLLFTACFLVIAGLEVMVSRGLDTRTGFTVSLALLIGLLTALQPAYFAALPEPLHTITGDMLSVTLFSAVVLTLIFRIGIRRQDSVAWQATDTSLSNFNTFIDTEAKAWKVGGATVDSAKRSVAALVERLKAGNVIVEPTSITAAYDQIDLLVEVAYRGRPPTLPTVHAGEHHEESSTVAGLKNYAHAMEADRVSVAADGDKVAVRLWFRV